MGDLIQLRDYQNPKDLARMYSEQTLEQQAVNAAPESIPYGGQGIDGMWTDTAPSEYCAPPEDCA